MKIPLDGEWRLEFFPQPAEGAVRSLPLKVAAECVRAEVPGCCELDLMRAGLLPAPERGLDALQWRKYEGHQWLYTRGFDAPDVPDGGKATLVFGGIDTLADVFLNGEKIGEAENMLVEHRFDATRLLRPGRNVLQVLIRSAFLENQSRTAPVHAHHMDMAECATLRKAAHMAGWDIFPRLYVSGLWRGVSLEVEGPVRLRDVFWTTGDYSQGPDGANKCRVAVQYRVEAPMATFLGGAKVRLAAERDGKTVAAATRKLDVSGNRVTFDAAGFDLWWPAGSGDHPLYDARVEVVSESGETLAADARKIGFRTVELVCKDIRADADPGAFFFKVNGEPVYMRGTNWVPTDAMPSRQAERILPTLALVEETHCNMVRVWGGGVYEPDFFYDWCDEHGVLVWQDFMTGCHLPPQDDAYAAATAAEAKAVVL
ncbi:MAG: glycoside hydrolase family 2, partial [Kiritimatiellae bacterium]|nr:glycoside hydrolase family 2 [Kiritimatiellia bacterium]